MDNFLKKLIEIKSFHPNFKELIKCKELIKNELLKLNIPDSKMYDIKDNLIYVINNYFFLYHISGISVPRGPFLVKKSRLIIGDQ